MLSLLNSLIGVFDDSEQIVVEAPVNIAITKYWGKRDVNLNIPLNDSISMTLDMRSMRTFTTITIHRNYHRSESSDSKSENSISLNHNEPIPFNKRINNLIHAIHQYLTHHLVHNATHNILDDLITIQSVNDFPTAAGLASSASGYAALAKGLCTLYGITNERVITSIARIGSGSASRSLHSGFVKWFASNPEHKMDGVSNESNAVIDPFDSFAEQIVDDEHWSDLRVIICVASSRQKEIGSSIGQILSGQTSELLPQRLRNVKRRDEELRRAIEEKDFDRLAFIAMKDSSDFHAICLDTFPPIFYLNETSRMVIKLCHLMNEWYRNSDGEYMVGYTFDAGPNAVLVVRNSECLGVMMHALKKSFFKHQQRRSAWCEDKLRLWDGKGAGDGNYPEMKGQGLEKIIVTRIGKGARIIRRK